VHSSVPIRRNLICRNANRNPNPKP